ncbi:cellulose synthase-like protein D4 isoform X1 [Cucumis melo]|uniref:Cellulose synthase-like protein D4 isoform X1 n=1 Tax=Cucumis melo TaxID=3656 RepID=A0ABM3KW81_CUCME|nr:cellulose synthase-like protein D4 isoform X1 [Cucumis melo]
MDSEAWQGVYVSHVRPLQTLINRAQILLHSIALLLLIFYRLSFFFLNQQSKQYFFPWLLVFTSELLLAFIWLLGRASRWRPQIPKHILLPPEKLRPQLPPPAIDVFICTADPEKEPTLEVMNTLISAMTLDYPPDKLHIYFSDDAGSPLTLHGVREARRFSRWWVPFCRKYGITQPCPQAYFSPAREDHRHDISRDDGFMEQKLIVREKYEEFKDGIRDGTKKWAGEAAIRSRVDHPALVQIIRCNNDDEGEVKSRNEIELPLLVYVSREKKPSHPHHFKAGALNVLLRVSGAMSNSPYILVLDCDMYCNDSTSARQAMHFHLHPHFSNSLSFVQFPQKFYNVTRNDIYDSQLRSFFTVEWSGMNNLQGPILSGTCFYIKRLSLFGISPHDKDSSKHIQDFEKFIESMKENNRSRDFAVEEAQHLASCTYENGSKWGQKDSIHKLGFSTIHWWRIS